jgi:hypothetical protein
VLGKLDRTWSDNDRSSLFYGYWERVEVRDGNGLLGAAETGWMPLGERQHTFTLEHTHTFTPQLLLDFRANVQVRDNFTYQGAPFNPTSLFGWSSQLLGAIGPSATSEFPNISFANFASMGTTSMGTNSNTNLIKDSLNVFSTITWIKQQHTVHAGIDLRFWKADSNVVGVGANFYTDDG